MSVIIPLPLPVSVNYGKKTLEQIKKGEGFCHACSRTHARLDTMWLEHGSMGDVFKTTPTLVHRFCLARFEEQIKKAHLPPSYFADSVTVYCPVKDCRQKVFVPLRFLDERAEDIFRGLQKGDVEFKDLPSSYRKDLDFINAAIEQNPYNFRFIDRSFQYSQKYDEVYAKASAHSPWIIRYSKYVNDSEYENSAFARGCVAQALIQDSAIFQSLSPKIQNDPYLMIDLIGAIKMDDLLSIAPKTSLYHPEIREKIAEYFSSLQNFTSKLEEATLHEGLSASRVTSDSSAETEVVFASRQVSVDDTRQALELEALEMVRQYPEMTNVLPQSLLFQKAFIDKALKVNPEVEKFLPSYIKEITLAPVTSEALEGEVKLF